MVLWLCMLLKRIKTWSKPEGKSWLWKLIYNLLSCMFAVFAMFLGKSSSSLKRWVHGLPPRVANQNSAFASSCPLADSWAIYIIRWNIIIDHSRNYHNISVCHPIILHKLCLQFLLGVKMAPRETENNAYAKFWAHNQRALWYVMAFSGVVNSALSGRYCREWPPQK